MGDVWSLESPIQDFASSILSTMYEKAKTRAGKPEREILKACFNSKWETIKNRFETEGSVWYVWYMDGVNAFISKHLQGHLVLN